MDLTLSEELAHVPDLRHRIRDIEEFQASFGRGAELVAGHTHVAFQVDRERAAAAFAGWAEKFSLQKPYSALDREDLSIFACGLFLAELIRTMPVRASREANEDDIDALRPAARDVARFWPEGFFLTSYCASVLAAILRQDGDAPVTLGPLAAELRTWWSFRENVHDDPAMAIGFFDLFLGRMPNWRQPEAAGQRPAIRAAAAHRHFAA